ncbi:hypothetical protein [Stenotrophomonas sp. PFBMAA-4]|uniref:hypothetical protein n=1 Tax=Stenotrophomonas sp. PFBMAA-4 TaxID=3043301 RepID=UPI0024B5D085|nr:hypothetical protein [Stenotrophomonas sp. PFBMAA-4]MDI9273807.1 hypothetical protein [Stenotrophomonas sp. PFBMAA-4]
MTILIVGFEEDIHGDAVSWALDHQKIPFRLIHFSNFPTQQPITISIAKTGDVTQPMIYGETNAAKENAIDLKSATAIWLRRPNTSVFELSGVHPGDLHYVAGECRSFCAGLIANLPESCTWINPLSAHYVAGSKARQLTLAARSGLKIPMTLMSNSAREIRKFVSEQKGGAVYKPLHPGFWNESNRSLVQYTTPVTNEMLENSSALELCPGIYQETIQKKYEIRANFFGSKIVAARIDSQAQEDTKSDWRVDVLNKVSIEPYDIPDDIADKIRCLMDIMELRFGCIDLVRDKQGDYIFLEVNEQGQFLWIEERCPEIAILGEFCDFLCRESGISFSPAQWPRLSDYLQSERFSATQKMSIEVEKKGIGKP